MIKKIVFQDMETTLAYKSIAGVRFFNDVGELVEMTPTITNGSTNATFNNATISCNVASYSSSYYLGYSFDTAISQTATASKTYWITNGQDPVITVEFEDGCMPDGISKIEFNASKASNRGLTSFKVLAYNEFDTLIGEHNVTTKSSAGANAIETVETYNFMNTYQVDDPQLIKTTDDSMIVGVLDISSVDVIQTEPEGTKVRYAFSFDNRANWFVFRNNVWSSIECSAVEIDSKGMTADEVRAIGAGAFSAMQTKGTGTFNYAISLSTSVSYRTPSVSQIQLSHVEYVRYS